MLEHLHLCSKCVERKECGSLVLGFLQRSLLVWAVTGVPSESEKRYSGVSAWPLWKAGEEKRRIKATLITQKANANKQLPLGS